MRKSNSDVFLTDQRQSPYALVFIAGQSLRQIVGMFWPLLLVYFLGRSSSWSDYYFILIGGISIILSLGLGILKYWRYTFHIEADEIIISKGVFKRSRVSIPFDRIQVVRINENIIHRVTHTRGLTIDTAGSGADELKILALDEGDAQALREILMDHAIDNEKLIAEAFDGSHIQEVETILQHNFLDTLRIGLTQNHLKSAGYIAAFFAFIFSQALDILGDRVLDTAIENYQSIFASDLFITLYLFIAIIIVSLIISLVLAFLRYFRLNVRYDGTYLRVISGLFNRQEQAVKSQRIQLYTEESNPLRKLIDIISINIQQPVSSDEMLKKSISIPGIRSAELDTFRSFALQQTDFLNPIAIKSRSVIKYRRFFFIAVIPAVLFSAVAYYFSGLIGLIPLIAIPLLYFLIHLWYKKLNLEICEDHIIRHGGMINTTKIFTDYPKIQNVMITQTPYQSRKELCSIVIFTAGGHISYPYIGYDEGVKLRDYLIYRLEASKKEWM